MNGDKNKNRDVEFFLGKYLLLNGRMRESIHWLGRFKTQSVSVIEAIRSRSLNEPAGAAPSLDTIADAIEYRLAPKEKSSVFFTEPYQTETIKSIRELEEINIPSANREYWTTGFVLLREFMSNAAKKLRESPFSGERTMLDGGQGVHYALEYEDLLTRAFLSFDAVENLFTGIKNDFDASCRHVLKSETFQTLSTSAEGLRQIHVTVVLLKKNGFFASKGYGSHEKVLGDKTVKLFKKFLSSG